MLDCGTLCSGAVGQFRNQNAAAPRLEVSAREQMVADSKLVGEWEVAHDSSVHEQKLDRTAFRRVHRVYLAEAWRFA
jgi:hypothetical protein